MHKEHRERNRGQCTKNIDKETEVSAQGTYIEKQRSVHKEHRERERERERQRSVHKEHRERERNRGQCTKNMYRETEVSAQGT